MVRPLSILFQHKSAAIGIHTELRFTPTRLLREALEARRETQGDRQKDTLGSINNYAMLLKAQGDLDGAAPLLCEALDGCRETLGDRHKDTLASMRNYARLLEAQGKAGEARVMRVLAC